MISASAQVSPMDAAAACRSASPQRRMSVRLARNITLSGVARSRPRSIRRQCGAIQWVICAAEGDQQEDARGRMAGLAKLLPDAAEQACLTTTMAMKRTEHQPSRAGSVTGRLKARMHAGDHGAASRRWSGRASVTLRTDTQTPRRTDHADRRQQQRAEPKVVSRQRPAPGSSADARPSSMMLAWYRRCPGNAGTGYIS